MLRRLLVVSASLAVLFGLTPVARACSCGSMDPRELLTKVDGAFVGTVTRELTAEREPTKSDPYVPMYLTFDIERSVKGEFEDGSRVYGGQTGRSACELSLPVGKRVGLVLDRSDGRWSAGLCSLVDPDELIRAGMPPPTPNGEGPPAFLATTTGEHSLATLDGSGRLLRYGEGKDSVSYDLCPGSEWTAEIDEVFGFVGGRPYIAAGRRELDTLALEDERRLVPLELPEPDEPFSVQTISCREPDASEMLVFGSHPAYDDDLILQVDPDGISELWKGHATAVVFAPDTDRAFFGTGKHGDERQLVELDIGTGKQRPIATLPGAVLRLAQSPDGERLVGVYGTGEVRMPERTFKADLFTVDVAGGEPASIAVGEGGNPFWLTDDRIGFTPFRGRGLSVYSAELKELTTKTDWQGNAVHADGLIYGAWDDAVHYSSIDEGPVRTFSEPGLPVGEIVIVLPPKMPPPRQAFAPPLEPDDTSRRSSGLPLAAAAAAAAVLAGSLAGVAILRRRRGTA